jgi:hypothetical protein
MALVEGLTPGESRLLRITQSIRRRSYLVLEEVTSAMPLSRCALGSNSVCERHGASPGGRVAFDRRSKRADVNHDTFGGILQPEDLSLIPAISIEISAVA